MSTSARTTVLMSPGMLILGLGGMANSEALAQIEFEISHTLPTATNVSGLVAADLNGDGRRDLAVSESLETVSLYVQQIDGTFVRRGSVYDPAATLSLLTGADLDLDGDTDLLWIGSKHRSSGPPYFTYSLSIFVNAQIGQGGQVLTLDMGTRLPGGLAVGDLDGDGIPEIVVADGYYSSSATATVRVFRRESGTYVLQQTRDLTYNDVRDVVLGDVDLDGDLDVFALDLRTYDDSYYGFKIYDSQIEVLLNDGAGQLDEGPHIDLVYGNDNHDPLPLALRTGDLDGDGDLDFALAAAPFYYSGPIALQTIESQNDGTSFLPHPQIWLGSQISKRATLAVADLDTDGDLDLLSISRTNNAWVLENRGGFEFQAALAPLEGQGIAPPILADFDNDGHVDLAESAGAAARLLSNVTPYFGPSLDHTPLSPGALATLTVTDAQPGERADFLYTMQGAGNSIGIQQLGGITLDLAGGIRPIGHAAADANGTATLQFTVPPNAPLREVVLQAAIRRGPGGADSVKTPFRTARINP